jgi:hypothetical protein
LGQLTWTTAVEVADPQSGPAITLATKYQATPVWRKGWIEIFCLRCRPFMPPLVARR